MSLNRNAGFCPSGARCVNRIPSLPGVWRCPGWSCPPASVHILQTKAPQPLQEVITQLSTQGGTSSLPSRMDLWIALVRMSTHPSLQGDQSPVQGAPCRDLSVPVSRNVCSKTELPQEADLAPAVMSLLEWFCRPPAACESLVNACYPHL